MFALLVDVNPGMLPTIYCTNTAALLVNLAAAFTFTELTICKQKLADQQAVFLIVVNDQRSASLTETGKPTRLGTRLH
jgi:hypothetical protein